MPFWRRFHPFDLILPEYSARHLFVVKLRLAVLLGIAAMYLYFFWGVIGQTWPLAGIVLGCILLTGVTSFHIIRNRFLLTSLVIESLCDLTAMTVVLYLTGGPYSPYFTIFVLYVLTAGILYTHYLAAIIAFVSMVYYGLFLLLCQAGVIPPLILNYGDALPVPTYTPFAHFLIAGVLFLTIVYTVKVASFFSQRRERILEKRNRELTALTRMSSTIRSTLALREVIEHLLSGVTVGLGLESVVLLHFDRHHGRARLYVPHRHPRHADAELIAGRSLDGVEVPMEAISSAVMHDILKHRIVFRREIAELIAEGETILSRDQCARIQETLGVQRIIIVPIVVERETLGALIGLSHEPFVEESQVSTMEAFANQSALALEAAMLIDRLRRLNDQLEEASRVKSEFLATMSHELRTPLTAIIGFSELLMEGVMGDLADEQKESLGEVLHNAADLLEMINSLLDLTKIEAGTMKMDLRSYELREVVRRVSSTLAPLLQRKEQELRVELREGIPTLSGDERKIQQTLLNLLANANKFTPQRGHIRLSAAWVPTLEAACERPWWPRFAEHEDLLQGGCVEVRVEDNGIGIPPDQLEKVFEMFHQADSSSTRNFGGTVLGLALARKFTEMHGGRIWAESELNKGTCFTLVLPVSSRFQAS